MIPPTPGPDPTSRMFGRATPPDGAGSLGPDEWWPTPIDMSFDDVLHAMNPLQHVPGVGMIYRAATGDEIKPPLKILGAGLLGGPLGVLGAALIGMVQELLRLGPDHSRPAVPAGFSMTGSEQQVEPVSPGAAPAGSYLTLATTSPEWLQSPANDSPAQFADEGARGRSTYAAMSDDYRRSLALEKGLA